MTKLLFRNILASVTLLFCMTSCCVADWYHDWLYEDAPPPTAPIAPVGGNEQTDTLAYSPDEIVSLVTDSLIFFFTANGIRQPGMGFNSPLQKDPEIDSIGLRIFNDLAKNKMLVPNREKPEYVLVFARSGKDVFQVKVVKYKTPGDFSNAVFTEQYKIKEAK